MKPVERDNEQDRWTSEDWTGEKDAVAAIALAASLAVAAVIFVLLAAIELSP